MKHYQRNILPVMILSCGVTLSIAGLSVISLEWTLHNSPFRGAGLLGLSYVFTGSLLILAAVSDLSNE